MKRKLSMFASAVVLAGLLAAAVASAASAPTAVTDGHTNVTDHSAVLHGTVNPNGSATTYFFQWGLTTAYGVDSVAQSTGPGTGARPVRTTATGLIPGTTYHYRLVATNAAGTTTGADHTFTTTGHAPPGVSTGPAANVQKNSAVLTGVINPNHHATTYFFRWGTTTAYGQTTTAVTVPGNTVPGVVTFTLEGLEAQTIFHFQLVATHSDSPEQFGADSAFMTLPVHRLRPAIRARTRPSLKRHGPFTFTTSGSVIGPTSIPEMFDCHGNVTVRFLRGLRQVGFTMAPLAPNCTFSGRTVFSRIPGGHRPTSLTVLVRFVGNGFLTPRKATRETVTLG